MRLGRVVGRAALLVGRGSLLFGHLLFCWLVLCRWLVRRLYVGSVAIGRNGGGHRRRRWTLSGGNGGRRFVFAVICFAHRFAVGWWARWSLQARNAMRFGPGMQHISRRVAGNLRAIWIGRTLLSTLQDTRRPRHVLLARNIAGCSVDINGSRSIQRSCVELSRARIGRGRATQDNAQNQNKEQWYATLHGKTPGCGGALCD